ncbi:glycosyltransferase family 4 protein [Vallitaleaceae bacterium 9-2]
MKRKVCHITSVHSRYDIRIFEKECVSLVRAGYDVTLLVNDINENEIRKGVKIESINFTTKNRISRILLSEKIFLKRALNVDADIYHFHDPELLPLGYKLKKIGKFVIYDSHEDVPRQILAKNWIPLIIRKPISFLYEKYENSIVKHLGAVVTPTPLISSRFSKINKKTVEVSNFPLLEEFNIHENLSKKNVACYVGGITKNRGIFQIADAMKNKDIELILCGNFESEELKSEILNNYSNIRYLGVVDRKKIAEVISESLFGFVTLLPTPNHINSYPIKMFEYMAGGIPVVASDFPLWKSIVESNDCGICVDPNDTNEISTAIDTLMENEKKCNQMGNNGRKIVLEKYNWGIEKEKLYKIYSDLQ